MHQTRAVVERARRGAADGGELVKRQAGLADARASGIRDRADDGLGAIARRTTLIARDDLVLLAVERRDDRADVCTAKVDAEEVVVAQTLGSLPASSGDDSTLASPSMTLFVAVLYPFFALSLPNVFSASAKIVVTSSARYGSACESASCSRSSASMSMRSSTIGNGRSIGSACSSTRISRLAMRSSMRLLPYWPLLYSAMSAFASAATMPARLPMTPAVGSGVPATGAGAVFSRPKPKSPRFFFSGGAAAGAFHSSTGGAGVSGGLSGGMREAAPAGEPHGSAEVVSCDAGADQELFAGGGVGATHVSGSGAGADGGGDHDEGAGLSEGGAPHGSSADEGAAGSGAAGLAQRSDPGAGFAGVPH